VTAGASRFAADWAKTIADGAKIIAESEKAVAKATESIADRAQDVADGAPEGRAAGGMALLVQLPTSTVHGGKRLVGRGGLVHRSPFPRDRFPLTHHAHRGMRRA
jgi:hypothetical protein